MNWSHDDGSPEHDARESGYCWCIKCSHDTEEEHNHTNHNLNCLWKIKANKWSSMEVDSESTSSNKFKQYSLCNMNYIELDHYPRLTPRAAGSPLRNFPSIEEAGGTTPLWGKVTLWAPCCGYTWVTTTKPLAGGTESAMVAAGSCTNLKWPAGQWKNSFQSTFWLII